MKKTGLIFGLACWLPSVFAQDQTDTLSFSGRVFTLGEVVVSSKVDRELVASSDMQNYNARDVGTALNMLPSVTFTHAGSRNETSVFLRGFDIRSVPVFIDGVPVYVPYDGTLDLGRFTTYDLSRIDVSKGYASMMYGANTLGGAINLIGLKPSLPLEVRLKMGIMSGRGSETALNAGFRKEKFYIQAGFSFLNRDFIPLSASFDTLALEQDLHRDNSYYKDAKASFKVGFTPNNTDEYSLNFMISHACKGNPVYIGNDPNTRARYWEWPDWDKRSLYFISRTAAGRQAVVKARLYYDVFQNKLKSYDDNTYTTQSRGYAFTSFYDDYTLGGHLEYEHSGDRNMIRMSAGLKSDVHREHNAGEPVRHFGDNTLSIGVEDVWQNAKFTLIPGLGYHYRKSRMADDFHASDQSVTDLPANSNGAWNAQLAAYYRVSSAISASFLVAWKSRFATMKDRYSYRLGTTIPNPELNSEKALNLEASVRMEPVKGLLIKPEIFFSHLNNTIQLVSNVTDGISQVQNTGSSAFAGWDVQVSCSLSENLELLAVYSFIHRENLSNPEILFTYVPKNKIFASASIGLVRNLTLVLSGEYNSKRNNASDGSRVSPGFAIANTLLTWDFLRLFQAEFGMNNLFDRNYTVEEGYPEMGRNVFLALHMSWQKQ